jgi:hypothetical protein
MYFYPSNPVIVLTGAVKIFVFNAREHPWENCVKRAPYILCHSLNLMSSPPKKPFFHKLEYIAVNLKP